MTYQEVSNLFTSNDFVKVVFTKLDGTERTLYGTIKNIPEDELPKTESPFDLRVLQSNYKCYDVVNEGWRSFTLSSVLSIEPIDKSQLPDLT
jgi:hypothetical protein